MSQSLKTLILSFQLPREKKQNAVQSECSKRSPISWRSYDDCLHAVSSSGKSSILHCIKTFNVDVSFCIVKTH